MILFESILAIEWRDRGSALVDHCQEYTFHLRCTAGDHVWWGEEWKDYCERESGKENIQNQVLRCRGTGEPMSRLKLTGDVDIVNCSLMGAGEGASLSLDLDF